MGRSSDFLRLLPRRDDWARSWTVTREELLDLIEAKGREVQEALAKLRERG